MCVAAGNSGPEQYTIGSPAAAAEAITVGNMIDTGKGGFALEPSSSRGPTADGRVKPDLCAPGTNTRSSINSSTRAPKISWKEGKCFASLVTNSRKRAWGIKVM